MNASVKIMLSYDYNHFEVCLSSTEEMTLKQVDEMRKQAQRLADKAVRQYQKAKDIAQLAEYVDINVLRKTCDDIRKKPESEWTPYDKANIKQLSDIDYWSTRQYDYEDGDF